MLLKESTIRNLAKMICGDEPFTYFPYRSSWYLTKFFTDIGLDIAHDGTTRNIWVNDVLLSLNEEDSFMSPRISHMLHRAVHKLLEEDDYLFDDTTDRQRALAAINTLFKQYKIEFDSDGFINYELTTGNNHFAREADPNERNNTEINQGEQITMRKVFISHSNKDGDYVRPMIDLLESLGLHSNQIFCSSFVPYGIPLGENFLEFIKNELNEESLVIFILSSNFMDSAVCLCEMGASWVKSKQHIPILIPPFDFNDIKGVIPHSQGFKINDSSQLNLFKDKVESYFSLTPLNFSSWEWKRGLFLRSVTQLIET